MVERPLVERELRDLHLFLCVTRATRFKDAWESFHIDIKAWAYRAGPARHDAPDRGRRARHGRDTSSTSTGSRTARARPCSSSWWPPSATTRSATGCGSTSNGTRGRNSTLADFLAALGEASKRDLREWSRVWIETSGLGSLGVEVAVEGDGVTSLEVVQEPAPQNDVLRPHRTEVALYIESKSGFATRVFPVLVEGARTKVPAASGEPRPAFVSVNHGDHAYAKVVLDPRSLAFVRERLEETPDPLLKVTLWGTLWQMVRDRKLAASAWCDLVSTKAQHETSPEAIETLLSSSGIALARYLVGERETASRRRLVARAWSRLTETEGDLHSRGSAARSSSRPRARTSTASSGSWTRSRRSRASRSTRTCAGA